MKMVPVHLGDGDGLSDSGILKSLGAVGEMASDQWSAINYKEKGAHTLQLYTGGLPTQTLYS